MDRERVGRAALRGGPLPNWLNIKLKGWNVGAALLALVLPGLVIHLATDPTPWFDEGLNTNTAATLSQYGVYGTESSDGFNWFDTAITSGPPLILPVALTFELFGPGMLQARLVSTAYALLALAMAYLVVARMAGRQTAFLSALALFATPLIGGVSFISMARQAMGETASLGLFLAGLWLWMGALEKDNDRWRIGCGILFGLSIQAKMQSGLPILPALGAEGLLLSWGRPLRVWRKEFLPLTMTIVTLASWLLITMVGTPASDRIQSAVVQWDAIRLLIVPGPFAHRFTRGLLVIGGVMLAALAATVPSFIRSVRRGTEPSSGDHAKVALWLVVAFDALWVLGLSIGWPRYAYLGFMLSVLLLVASLMALLKAWQIDSAQDRRMSGRLIQGAFVAIVGVSALWTTTAPAWGGATDDPAPRMAQYIDLRVPSSAIVETWEWQIDALGDHRMFHHPSHLIMLQAIAKQFVVGRSVDLSYPIQEPAPPFLLIGPFGAWTGIYAPWIDSGGYQLVHQDGAYSLYALRQPLPSLPGG